MPVNPVIRVRINDSKLTATEINSYAGKDGRKMNLHQLSQTGNDRNIGIVNGKYIEYETYCRVHDAAEHNLREFVIKKINIQNGDEDIPDKYSREQYGECVSAGKIYNARILDGGGIILI